MNVNIKSDTIDRANKGRYNKSGSRAVFALLYLDRCKYCFNRTKLYGGA